MDRAGKPDPFCLGGFDLCKSIFGALGCHDIGRTVCRPIYTAILRGGNPGIHVGILWGFATKVEGPRATTGYLLAAVPALWVFFMTGGGPVSAGFNLMFGFAGLLVLDFAFWRCGLAPDWWMKLRIPLTAIILICLGTAVFL